MSFSSVFFTIINGGKLLCCVMHDVLHALLVITTFKNGFRPIFEVTRLNQSAYGRHITNVEMMGETYATCNVIIIFNFLGPTIKKKKRNYVFCDLMMMRGW